MNCPIQPVAHEPSSACAMDRSLVEGFQASPPRRNDRQTAALLLPHTSCMLVTVFCFLFTICACVPQKEQMFRKSRILMDTQVAVTVVDSSKDSAEKAIDAAFAEIEKIEKLTNFFSPESEISLINKNAGVSPVKVSPEVLDLIDRAVYASKMTEGAFDITIGAVSRLYDFHAQVKPETQVLQNHISLVNYRDVAIDKLKSTVFLRKRGMLIDTGGVTKGYAADRAAEALQKQGITSGLVAVAGDIKTFGTRPDGKPWQIGIRNPRTTGGEDDIMATIPLSNRAVSTSGDYERSFTVDGIRYHHILDPGTGYPANGCRSVTVIAQEAVITDAFSTGVFVLGPEKGIQVLGKLGIDGLIIDNKGNTYVTPWVKEHIERKKSVL